MEPMLDEVKQEYDIEVEKVNVEEEPDRTNKSGVISIPTIIIYKDDVLVKTFTGAVPKETLVSYL
jgi:thioredoxin 1